MNNWWPGEPYVILKVPFVYWRNVNNTYIIIMTCQWVPICTTCKESKGPLTKGTARSNLRWVIKLWGVVLFSFCIINLQCIDLHSHIDEDADPMSGTKWRGWVGWPDPWTNHQMCGGGYDSDGGRKGGLWYSWMRWIVNDMKGRRVGWLTWLMNWLLDVWGGYNTGVGEGGLCQYPWMRWNVNSIKGRRVGWLARSMN